jgi:hypothetical protein
LKEEAKQEPKKKKIKIVDEKKDSDNDDNDNDKDVNEGEKDGEDDEKDGDDDADNNEEESDEVVTAPRRSSRNIKKASVEDVEESSSKVCRLIFLRVLIFLFIFIFILNVSIREKGEQRHQRKQ